MLPFIIRSRLDGAPRMLPWNGPPLTRAQAKAQVVQALTEALALVDDEDLFELTDTPSRADAEPNLSQ